MIEIDHVTKRYAERIAVDQLVLNIAQGELFGFVGPNGAGKTTTLRMIAGLLEPEAGEIQVGGYSVRGEVEQVKRLIGYMPDYFGVYPDLKTWEYLDFFAACYRIPENTRPALINELLDLVDLQIRRDDPVDRLSRGMKQRLSLARTLIHDPQVLVLDEPASGLDPRARVEIRALLVELASMGKTIFFSTHILADVAEICSRVGIIEAGKLAAVGTLEELHAQILPHRQVEITLLGPLQPAIDIVQQIEGVLRVQIPPSQNGLNHQSEPGQAPGEASRNHLIMEFQGNDRQLSQVLATLVQQGISVLDYHEDQRDLEHLFMHATRGIVS